MNTMISFDVYYGKRKAPQAAGARPSKRGRGRGRGRGSGGGGAPQPSA